MKTLKIITVSLIFAVFMIMPVMANENNYYKEQFEASGAENLPDALSDEARELLKNPELEKNELLKAAVDYVLRSGE